MDHGWENTVTNHPQIIPDLALLVPYLTVWVKSFLWIPPPFPCGSLLQCIIRLLICRAIEATGELLGPSWPLANLSGELHKPLTVMKLHQ